MKKNRSPKRKTIASRLKGIAGIQVLLCVILFLLMFINQPAQTYRQYQQDTTQTAALFSAKVSENIETLIEASKFAGQILNTASDKTFIANALEGKQLIQNNFSFCRELYSFGKTLSDQLSFLDKVTVFDLQGNAVYVSRSRSSYYLTKTAPDAEWFEQTLAKRGGAMILPPSSQNHALPSIFNDELVIARAVFDPIKLRATGVYALSIPRDSLEAVFDTYRINPDQEYALIYQGKRLLDRFDSPIPEMPQKPLRTIATRLFRQDGVLYLYSCYHFLSDSYLVIRAPVSSVLTEMYQINAALLIVVFLILCLFVTIIWRLVRDILQPLQSLTGALDATTDSFFPTITPSDLPQDLEPLFSAYNRMSSRIDLLVNEGLRKDVERREMELQLLRTQINPHYLYNTLECIHMRAYVNHDFEVARMAELLGGNLQYGLRATNAKVPLYQEFEKAGEYITLVGYHYGERVRVISHLDESIRECMVIKLLLQPLIENAIQHGLTPEKPLNIEVLGYPRDEHTICLQVSDDGEGMTPEACKRLAERLEAEQGENAIGLRSVHRRLRLRYGPEYGVTLKSILHQSTVVTITLPRENRKEEA